MRARRQSTGSTRNATGQEPMAAGWEEGWEIRKLLVGVGDDGGETGGSFGGDQVLGPDLVRSGGERVGAVLEHSPGEWLDVGGGSDAEVAKHGVRLPTTEELDHVTVDPGAHEGRSSAGAEAAGGYQVGRDSCLREDVGGGEAERTGDVLATDVEGFVGREVNVVDRSGRIQGGLSDRTDTASEGSHGTDDAVAGGMMRDRFAPDRVLLVSER